MHIRLSLLTISAALLLSACSKQVACDSDAAQSKLLHESALRFQARLQEEYELTFVNALNLGKSVPVRIAEQEVFNNTDIEKLARDTAKDLRFEGGRLIRRNYVAGELLCAGTLITPNDTRVPVSYEVSKDDNDGVAVQVRGI
ncbi:hypothetical protein [Aliidiomarina sp.]|uniref:hypothetical protein n=1 Tax=Aliidiomarina sp. TaxID=1872439 RepID=UPI003A4DB890